MTNQQWQSFERALANLSPQDKHDLINRIQQSMREEEFRVQETDVTVFDLLDRAGTIGCIKGAPRSPADLSTNPRHMEGFGRD
jgi:hypothetical protein